MFWFIGFNVSLTQFLGLNPIIHSTRAIATSTILIIAYYIYFNQIKNFDRHIQVIFYLFFFTCMGGVLESTLGLKPIYVEHDVTRAFGFFGNPNETGLQCNLTLLLSLYLFTKRKIGFIVLFAGMSVGIYGGIMSFSKSAILLTFVILTGYFLYNILYFRKLGFEGVKRFGKLVLIITTVLVFFVVPKVIFELNNLQGDQMKRINDLYKMIVLGQIDSSTTSDRTIALEQGLDVYSQRPIFGHGLNSFSQGDLFQLGLGVHNTYLKILGEGGAVSISLWLLFLFTYLYYGFSFTKAPDSFFVIGIIAVISFYFLVSHTVLSRKFVVPLLSIAMTLMYFKRKVRLKPQHQP